MKNPLTRQVLQGIGITQGKASAPLFFHMPSHSLAAPLPVLRTRAEEETRLRDAVAAVRADLSRLQERATAEAGSSAAQIFDIHAMLLEDEDLWEALQAALDEGHPAERAVELAVEKFSVLLQALEDDYLSERCRDLADLANQIREKLGGGAAPQKTAPKAPYILVAEDLSPSETVRLDKSRIAGFVTFLGSASSHTAILARAMGIPALVGVGRITEAMDGAWGLLDAAKGELILGATAEEKEAFAHAQAAENRIAKEHEAYLLSLINKPAITRGGHKIMIYANLANGSEVDAALSQGAEGIGLLRSEFLYLEQDDFPSEELLFSAYADIASQMQGRRTIIRTLDVGADKQIPYFNLPQEENPALGFRAIRLCLARKEMFCTQLRAILRASAYGRVAIMLPMIVSVAEVRECRRLLEKCKKDLEERGLLFDAHPELGIMIETPAAAVMSEELAREVDFFSVGTNDLLQYTLAADRQNAHVAHLCEEHPEPVLRLIGMAAEAIHKAGGWIGICGEMAADLRLTQRFVDLGIDELSVSPPYLLGVRGRVCECH